MGYDMHFVTKPAGEAEQVEAARALFYAACQIRDHKQRTAADTPAQRAVNAAYELMQDEEVSYFRLNIWGMSRYASAMLALGMVYDSRSPAFPPAWDYRGEADETLWFGVVDHVEDGEARPDAATDELVARARAYVEEAGKVRRHHPDGGDVIPVHKFGTNDGWVVTPDEIKAALAVYDALPVERVEDVLAEEVGHGERRDYWDRWIGWLELAVDHDGFEVW